jgi:Uma2 family endonuclease
MREHPHMSEATRLFTAEELEKFPDDDYKYELVEGRVIRMSPTGAIHGWLVGGLLSKISEYARIRGLGFAFTEVGFTLAVRPDTVRAPDVSFVRRDRLPPGGLPRGFWKGAPDLAVEVLSPDDRPSEMRAKVAEYLRFGVPLVVVIDPDEKIVVIHRALAQPITLQTGDVLDLSDVVSGFQCSLREIFAEI